MDLRRQQILHDIGIDVWRMRPVSWRDTETEATSPGARDPLAQPDVPQAPPDLPVAVAQDAPSLLPTRGEANVRLSFNYVKTTGGICLFGEPVAGAHKQFVRDLVAACVHLLHPNANSANSAPGKLKFSVGEFKWPILDGGGSPERALHAFFTKHEIAGPGHWLLATPDVLADIDGRYKLDALTIEIPPIGKLAGDAALKRQLWERLKQALV